MRTHQFLPLSLCALVPGLLGPASPAGPLASHWMAAPFRVSFHTTPSRPAAHRAASTSSTTVDQVSQNWAGLVQEGTAETRVSASWVVPSSFAATAPSQSAVAEWVGLGGMKGSSLIQVGTVTSPGSNGSPVTTVFWEDLPSVAVTGTTVAPGTTVTATISPNGTDKWLLELTANDSSTPLVDHLVTLTPAQAKAIESSADWITEAPSSNQGILPLAPVSSTTMTHLLANNQPLASLAPSSLVTIALAQGPVLAAVPTVNTAADSLTVNTLYGTLAPLGSPGPGGFPGGFGVQPPLWPLWPQWANPNPFSISWTTPWGSGSIGIPGFSWGNPWGSGFFSVSSQF
ncbi:MAG: G1 family endopeptidase [Firmicutes bacterium]|nr:G1 family endopeptidase [Bacillota bacterium]